jgi:hypothetical protein
MFSMVTFNAQNPPFNYPFPLVGNPAIDLSFNRLIAWLLAFYTIWFEFENPCRRIRTRTYRDCYLISPSYPILCDFLMLSSQCTHTPMAEAKMTFDLIDMHDMLLVYFVFSLLISLLFNLFDLFLCGIPYIISVHAHDFLTQKIESKIILNREPAPAPTPPLSLLIVEENYSSYVSYTLGCSYFFFFSINY